MSPILFIKIQEVLQTLLAIIIKKLGFLQSLNRIKCTVTLEVCSNFYIRNKFVIHSEKAQDPYKYAR